MQERVKKIANEIMRKRSNFGRFRNDFSKIKKKIDQLESEVIGYRGDNANWEIVEVWKPLGQEIIEDLEHVLGKVEITAK